MPFYKDMEKKTRQQKRTEAFARGGFEEEGYSPKRKNGYGEHHGRNNSSERGEFGNSYGKPDLERNGRGKSFGKNKPERKGFIGNERSYGKTYGNPEFVKSEFGKSAGKRFGESRYDRPSYGNVQQRGEQHGKPGFHHERFEKSVLERRPLYEDSHWNPETSRCAPKAETLYSQSVPARYDDSRSEIGEDVPPENLLAGRNPIREALKSGRDIEKLLVARGELTGSAREILAMAKERRIPVQEVDRTRLDAISRGHQGMLAFASAYQYSTVESMLENARERGEDPFLILLDGITDPHNLGAIIRSAECCGAHGVIVQERRAVGLTPAAVKASAGAVEYMPVARVTNLTNTIEMLQAQNVWVYAADMDGEDYRSVDFSGPVALVIGAEGEGVGRRVLDECDKVVSLPIRGHVDSLNASVAAGILMYAAAGNR